MLLNFSLQAAVSAIAPYTQLLLRNKGYSHSLVGVIVAIGQVASIFFPVLFGMLSDRTRKTRLLFVLLALGTAVAFVPTALSGSVAVTIGCFFVASALFWSINPMNDGYENRVFKGDSSKYGVGRAMGTLGYLVCLVVFALTGFPVETDNRSIALCTVVTLSVFCFMVLFAPKDEPRSVEPQGNEGRFFSFDWFSSKFYLMMFVVALTRIAEAVIDKLLSSYMTEDLNLGGRFALFVALGAASEFVMMVVGGRLMQKGKVSAYGLIVMSAIGMIVRLLIYRFFPTIEAFTVAQLLHSFTFGALHIGVSKFVAQNVNESHYSLAMSFYWAIATNLPEMIGVLAGGFVIDIFGYGTLFASYVVFPVLALVICLANRRKLSI